MKKIIIIGSPGTGKSTIGRQLEEKLGIDLYHLDKLFWKPNWAMSTNEEQLDILCKVMDKESWIIDGNYSDTLGVRIKQADTIIYLKRSRPVCFYHVFKRFLTYKGKTRPDMKKDCPEKIDRDFIKWIWKFPEIHEPLIDEYLNQLSESQKLIKLTNQKEIDFFFYSLSSMR